MSKHPNATVGLVAGSGLGSGLAWLLNDVASLGVPDPAIAGLAGLLAAFALFVGRRGLRGLIRAVWRGQDS